MAPELNDGGALTVMDEEELRPPESWPGAGGLKSVAPYVPSWPTGPIPGLRPPEGAVTAAPAKKGTGEGWPGAGGGSPAPAQASPAEPAAPEPAATPRSERASGGHPAMGPSIGLLLACLAIAVWVLLDANSRVLQASVLAVVLIVGGVFVTRTLRRGGGSSPKG